MRVFCNGCGEVYDENVGDGNCWNCGPVEKDSPEQKCQHGVDVYNCYDGCYDEMKNGTVS